MKKHFLITLFALSVVELTSAQQWEWAKVAGESTGNNHNPVLRTDKWGNIFTAVTKGPCQLAKYTNAGNLLWSQTITGKNIEVKDLSVDKSGNSYLLGFFSTDIVFADSTYLIAGNTFIVCFDPAGKRQWVWNFAAASLSYITNDNDGNLVYVSAGMHTIWWLIKLSPKGVILGNRKYTSSSGIGGPTRIKTDAQNNIYIAGNFSGYELEVEGAIYHQTLKKHYSSYIAKLDSSWEIQHIEIALAATIQDFGLDGQSNIYVKGYFEGTMQIGQYTFTVHPCSPYCTEYFLAKLSAYNTCAWARHSEKTYFGNALAVAANGDFYTAGSFLDTLHVDSVMLTEPIPRYYVYVLKFNSNGVAQWGEKDAGATGSGSGSSVCSIAFDGNQSTYIGGSFHNHSGKSWFDKDTLPITIFGTELFIAKMNDRTVNSVFAEMEGKDPLELFPNPSTGIFMINLSHDKSAEKIIVRDVLGNILFDKDCHGNTRHDINLGRAAKGIYFVELLSDETRIIRKIVVQ